MQCLNVEYKTVNIIVFSTVVALQREREREREGLTADCVLSQCWKLVCFSRCLYTTSTQQQREPFFFFFSPSLSISYPRAAALVVDGWKKTFFASICNSVVFVFLFFSFLLCFFLSFSIEEKNILSWHNEGFAI